MWLRMEHPPWIIWLGPILSHRSIKSENLFSCGQRKSMTWQWKDRGKVSWEEFHICFQLWDIETSILDRRMDLRRKRQSQSRVRKKTGPQSHNCINPHPAKPLLKEEAKRPQGLQTRTQRRHQHLEFSLVRPCPTSDPKKWEIINFCYLLTLKGVS